MASRDSQPITVSEQIEIDAPPPAVWNIFRDLEAWPAWNPACPEAAWTAGPSWRKGSTFRLRVQMGDATVSRDAVLVEDDYPWILAWTSTAGGVTERRQFDLDWYQRKTLVTDTITLSGASGQIDPASLEADARSMSQSWLRALRDEVVRNGMNIWNLSSAESPRSAPLRSHGERGADAG